MYQVPIEDVLAEFREKYRNRDSVGVDIEKDVPLAVEFKPQFDKQTDEQQPHTPIFMGTPTSSGRHYTFRKIAAIQAIAAAAVVAAMIVLRFVSPDMFEYIAEVIRQRL